MSTVGRRGGRDDTGGGSRLLSALLTEMDGLELATGLFVIAATNRPERLDPAFIRPGRLDVLQYVPPPDVDGRLQILEIHTREMPLADNVNLRNLAAITDHFTGVLAVVSILHLHHKI